MARSSSKGLLFFVNLIVGLYFINFGFNFVNLQFLDAIKNWIVVAGGALLIISGLMLIMRPRVPVY
jgi:hypothetical protein